MDALDEKEAKIAELERALRQTNREKIDLESELALAERDEEQAEAEKEVAGYSRRKSGSAAPKPRLPEDVETVTVEIVCDA